MKMWVRPKDSAVSEIELLAAPLSCLRTAICVVQAFLHSAAVLRFGSLTVAAALNCPQ